MTKKIIVALFTLATLGACAQSGTYTAHSSGGYTDRTKGLVDNTGAPVLTSNEVIDNGDDTGGGVTTGGNPKPPKIGGTLPEGGA